MQQRCTSRERQARRMQQRYTHQGNAVWRALTTFARNDTGTQAPNSAFDDQVGRGHSGLG
eukprot:3619798-Lingulodinium_polyedra.AAC.1